MKAVGPVWRAASILIALGVLAPVLSLAWLALGSGLQHWAHLAEHVLPQAALNTAMLLAGVGVLVLVIGTGCAWLVTACDFPGRRVLHWALLLPLAMPTYIVAFAYLDLLHPIGPVQGLSAGRWASTARASSACPTCARCRARSSCSASCSTPTST